MRFTEDGEIIECMMDVGPVNALSRADIQSLDVAISQSENNPQARILVFKSHKISPHQHPIFCAGANQKERIDWSRGEILEHLAFQRSVIHRLRTTRLCTICCVDGLALGLGVEMCLAADFVMATENSRFAFPEKNWGIIPGAGGWAWAHGWAKHPEQSLQWIKTGECIDREHAQWLGVVDVLCDEEDFDPEIHELLDSLRQMSIEAQLTTKKRIHEKIDYKFYFEQEQAAYAEALSLKKS